MRFPLNIAMLLLVLLVINWMTFSGEWWVQGAALGLGIVWAITVYRVMLIKWMRSKGAWWVKWAVVPSPSHGLPACCASPAGCWLSVLSPRAR